MSSPVKSLPVTNLPWVEKYRPATLDDLVSHKEIIQTINKLLNGNQLPHLLFYGPPGTGKTSTILATAKRIYGPQKVRSMVLELNASDDRGISVVREEIISFAQSKSLFGGTGDQNSPPFKLIILDEADAMTKDAQNALRRVIEKFTDNVRFCIICNYLNKIVPAIQSRCTRFRFSPLLKEQILPRLEHVIKTEGLSVTPEAKNALFDFSAGDMRRILNILQSTALAFNEVTEDAVYACVGQPKPLEIRTIINCIFDSPFEVACERINKFRIEKGFALTDFLDHLLKYVLAIDADQYALGLLLDEVALIHERLAVGCSEKLQLYALISACTEYKLACLDKAEVVDDGDEGVEMIE